jgi:hypothetical protein
LEGGVAESRQKRSRRIVRTRPIQRFLASLSVEKYQAKRPRIRSPKKNVRRGVMTVEGDGETAECYPVGKIFFIKRLG